MQIHTKWCFFYKWGKFVIKRLDEILNTPTVLWNLCLWNKFSTITSLLRSATQQSPFSTWTPRSDISAASAVAMAMPLWSVHGMTPDPWRDDLWPEGHHTGLEGQLLLEDSKSTSPIGYHLPFLYPHLYNWHIDQLALCTLLAAQTEWPLLFEIFMCQVIVLKVFLCVCKPETPHILSASHLFSVGKIGWRTSEIV